MKTVYVDMDGVMCDIAKQIEKKKIQNPAMPFPQAEYGFFMEMEEIEDAVNAVRALADHYDVAFATALSWKNPMSAAEKIYWIGQHVGIDWMEHVIPISNKSRLIGDFLVDDNIKGRGQEKFNGEVIHFGHGDARGWREVFNYLMNDIVITENLSL